ncbi:unnamed protein product, partial [Allacma fusca]
AKDDMESMCDQLATEAAGIVDSPERNTRSQHSCPKQLNARTEDTSERDASSSSLPEVSSVQHNDSEANSCSDKRYKRIKYKLP